MGNKNEKNEKDIHKYEILFLGEKETGTKTSLIQRMIEGKFKPVSGNSGNITDNLILEKRNRVIVLKLKDGGKMGQLKLYNTKSDIIILGYDITNTKSFEKIKTYWSNEIKKVKGVKIIYLLGNKIDRLYRREIDKIDGEKFADSNNMRFFEISVKKNINIRNFIQDLLSNIEKDIANPIPLINNNDIIPSKKIYKVAFIGDSYTGAKTSLINRLMNLSFEEFYPSNAPSNFISKEVKLENGYIFNIDLWDTNGYERYRSLIKLFIKNSDCVVLGYDITRLETFNNIKNFWLNYAKEHTDAKLMYLIGNKTDLYYDEQVDENTAREFAQENNLRFFVTSCKQNYGIQNFLDDLIHEIIKI